MDQTTSSAAATHALWIALAIVLGILIILVIWIVAKGRRLPGEHVFRASRLSRGNHLFPAQVVVIPTSLTLYKPQWIGKLEESIHMAHIASLTIDTHLMFADVTVETSGGRDPVICHGHTKRDAVEMKRVTEEFQSDLYRGKGPAVSPPVPKA